MTTSSYRIEEFIAKEIFVKLASWLSEETFEILKLDISITRYTEGVWIQKFVLALIFAKAFKICKIHKIKTDNKFPLYSILSEMSLEQAMIMFTTVTV